MDEKEIKKFRNVVFEVWKKLDGITSELNEIDEIMDGIASDLRIAYIRKPRE